MKTCRKYMLPLLAVLLFALPSSTDAAQCGSVPDCDDTNGDCVNDVCFCEVEFMGTNCKTGCGTCTSPQVCTGATDCAACIPACDGTGGTCATVDTAPKCKCNAGFHGESCADEYCPPTNPCQNGGTCEPADGSCTCAPLFTGPTCEIAATACGSEKCATGQGTCKTDTCYCEPLFMGTHCASVCEACTGGQVCNAADTCAACDPVCDDVGGTCSTVDTTPDCNCNLDFGGDDCSTITCGTGESPCTNGGTCDNDICLCDKDHAGKICQLACAGGCTDEQKCIEVSGSTRSAVCKATCTDNASCLNEGTCGADKFCDCADGFEGDLCADAVLVCAPVCTAAQKCVEVDGSNVCKTKCANNDACLNGGTCGNELCTCTEGWTGDLCADSGVTTVLPSVLAVALLLLLRLL